MQEAVELFNKLQEEVPFEESQFPKIADRLVTLDKYKVEISPDLRKLEKNIPVEWNAYIECLNQAEKMLCFSKVIVEDIKRNQQKTG